MSDYDYDSLARSAYQAYGKVTDYKNYQGLDMPTFDALTPTIQQAWIAAVKDVYFHVSGQSSVETGENVCRAVG